MTTHQPARTHEQREWRAAVVSQFQDVVFPLADRDPAGHGGDTDAIVGELLHEALDKAGLQLAPRVDSPWDRAEQVRVDMLAELLRERLGVTVGTQALREGLELANMVLAPDPLPVRPPAVRIVLTLPAATSIAAVIEELATLPRDAELQTTSGITLTFDVPGRRYDEPEEPF